jgi:hypothetical protein
MTTTAPTTAPGRCRAISAQSTPRPVPTRILLTPAGPALVLPLVAWFHPA